ncbi:radical SAM protein, partial [Streptomyces sp. YS-3]|uniref:radical SAM protein n=1 Tax=Streptomyces sp. YS-3 TaxID=3381352 RepID=UPI00386290C4
MTTAGEPRWPHRELDPDAVRPVPLRQFVLKVHSRCNLACDYCYIYRGQDASWRERPARVPEATVRRTARRIAEHAADHRLTALRIDLHGGEPLLGGAGPVLAYAAEVRRAVREAVRGVVPGGCEVTATVQTNGTLLTPRTLDRLAAGRVRVGLSLDGGAARLNTRRTDRRGRSSWPAVAEAARLLARRPGAYAGILCTVDLAADPADVYRSLLALGPPGIDLLLPHG